MDFSAIKTLIRQNIKTNENEEITGAVLQNVLIGIIDTLGELGINGITQQLYDEETARQNADSDLNDLITLLNNLLNEGYLYGGIANPNTEPVIPDGKIFYICGSGTYTNFGSQVIIPRGFLGIFSYSSSWTSMKVKIYQDDTLYIEGYKYFELHGEITSWTDSFRVSKPMIVEEGSSVLNCTSAYNGAPCCVVYDADMNIVKIIEATTPSPLSGACVKDISYEDIKEGVYWRWCNDERYPAEVVGTISMSQKGSVFDKRQEYAFMNSASVFASEMKWGTCLLDIDTEAGTVRSLSINYVMTDKSEGVRTVPQQVLNIDFPTTFELYVVYIDKENNLRCSIWSQFDSADADMVICRFSTNFGALLSDSSFKEAVRLDYTRCPVRINGQRRDLDSIGVEVQNLKYYSKSGATDFSYFEVAGKQIQWNSCFKVSKYFKVESGVSVLSCTSPYSVVPCCVVYDEKFNVIKTIVATTASPFDDAFLKDITYNDLQGGTYFRWCCDLRYPAVVNSVLHEAENLPVFPSSDLMEADLGGTNLSDYDTICYNDYHEAQEMEVYALRVRCKAATDTNILLINTITHSYKVLQTIKADAININDYIYVTLDVPVRLKPNQYIGFNTNIKWRSYENNGYKGSFFLDDDNIWQNYESSIWAYGLYVRPIKDFQIRKTVSILGDSIATNDYVKLPSRNYWRALLSHTGMSLCNTSIAGGTCIMQGLRSTGMSFTEQSRWGALFSNGQGGDAPDIIIVEGGINDFGTSPEDSGFIKYADLGSMADAPSPTTSFYSAMKYLLQQLSLTYPTSQIVVCIPMKMFALTRLSSVQPLINNHGLMLSQFVNAMKEVAAEYGAITVDLFSDLPITKDNMTLYMADTFHPKDEGCALIERLILEKLLEVS